MPLHQLLHLLRGPPIVIPSVIIRNVFDERILVRGDEKGNKFLTSFPDGIQGRRGCLGLKI